MNHQFWINRIKKYGHTGWANYIVYHYDQYIRKVLVEKILKKYRKKLVFNRSLDFGCGTGDFSVLLSKYSKQVIGVDIHNEIVNYAIKNNSGSNIKYRVISNGYIYTSKSYDLILSITVMQHIILENDLKNTLEQFYNSLTDDGIIVIIESFGTNGIESGYMNLRQFESFVSTTDDIGFEIIEIFNLYHPDYSPTKLFSLYRNSSFVRMLNLIAPDIVLKKVASFIASYDTPIQLEESMTKLVILRKKI